MPAGGRGRALPSSWRFYAAGPGDPPAASRPAPPAPRRALRFRACPLPPQSCGGAWKCQGWDKTGRNVSRNVRSALGRKAFSSFGGKHGPFLRTRTGGGKTRRPGEVRVSSCFLPRTAHEQSLFCFVSVSIYNSTRS